MSVCSLCHQEVSADDACRVPSDGREILVHTSCFGNFSSLVMEAMRVSGARPPGTGLERVVKTMDGGLVLIHRSFPNEQMPFLVYLAMQKDPVIVTEMYTWAEQNEFRSSNPSTQVMRLKNKDLVATYDKDGERYVFITESRRKVIEEYAASLA